MARLAGSILSLLVLAALTGCESDETLLQPVFGSPEAIATVRSAPTVTAQLLGGEGYHREKSSEYETRGEPVELTADQAKRLRTLLLDPGAYEFDMAKGCEPVYGVRLRFEDAAGSIVDVLLCFECDILAVYRDDVSVGGEDFDEISDELRSLMKELFPEDSAIQSL